MWNLALDRPIVGGGFDYRCAIIYQRYAPDRDRTRVLVAQHLLPGAEASMASRGCSCSSCFGYLIWRHAKRLGAESAERPGLELVGHAHAHGAGVAAGVRGPAGRSWGCCTTICRIPRHAGGPGAATVQEEQTARAIVPPPTRAAAAQT
jgi:hypothetical protein